MTAYACVVIRDNFSAIISESGGKIKLDFISNWFEEHGSGYFLRDDASVLDCNLFADDLLFNIYAFESQDTGALFRKVVKI